MRRGLLGSGFCTTAERLAFLRSARMFSTVLSVSALRASSTFTCRMRCTPPCRSKPRWIRLVRACLSAAPEKPEGIPMIPQRQTSTTATIRMILLLRFFFMVPIHYSKLERRAPQSSRAEHLRCRGAVLGSDGGDGVLGHFHLDSVGSHFDDDGVVFDGEDG